MRRLLTVFVFCISSFLFVSSCDLTEYNPGGITSETVYTTPEGFESLVNAAYSYSRWWYGKEEGWAAGEMGTDLWTSGAGDENPNFTRYESLQPNANVVGVFWEQFYSAINLCNAGINRIGESGMSEELQTTRLAELRFLRAFYYWHIVEMWGGVHFTTDETEGIQVNANKSSVETFYNQIFEDLDFAVNNLPVTTSDIGRVTKPAAEAFLARMYLTRGMDQEAFNMADKVINDYSFGLVENYDDLWEMDNLRNEEVIWVVNYSEDLALNDQEDDILFPEGHGRGGHNGHLHFFMTYDQVSGMDRDIENGRPFNRYMPTQFLLDLYQDDIDSRYDGSFKSVWYSNAPSEVEGMAEGDTAIYATKYEVSEEFREDAVYTIYDRSDIYESDGSIVQRTKYPSLDKFADPTRPSISEMRSSRDAFVIRLAEMYLIAAEAQFNRGNNTEAANYINVIRERAAKPGNEAAMRVTAADIDLDFILDERARELAGEQLRWFDLKRTGTLLERTREYNPEAGANIQDHHVLRPIPQSQIDAVQNKDEFTQNAGYQ
ncbi:RagB/SusD family nutrient uptake outer membrane protein [Fodinibius salsisoli]|uniref:RagB/SusD family nutrient uptake outer membrane protein n=1 Tax=Fodinibius salsisoli TaxID=2820877 RepID=A0ABT3PKV4_9BACT|nr:RagB/SusD family nutrient uptake outer membrane protein [Fodinibius salsisoli]MCW9706581.1 RagB/SusD family nutrient uptake outer membrane protein [Fodinibius salsisoli]